MLLAYSACWVFLQILYFMHILVLLIQYSQYILITAVGPHFIIGCLFIICCSKLAFDLSEVQAGNTG